MAHIQLNFYSALLKKNTNVMVFIPSIGPDDYLFGSEEKFNLTNMKYQVLYLLHGSYDDYTSWSRNSKIECYAQEKCLAVVMPSAENSAYLNMYKGEAYQDYIANELPEFLETILPISTRREDSFIAGLSMGGGGAFRFALTFPEKYQAAASLSGGLHMGILKNCTHLDKMPENYMRAVYGDKKYSDVIELLDEVKSEVLPPLYMICGTEDFIFPSNESFYKKALDKKIPITYETARGVHCWDFWDEHIRDVLNWMPLKEQMV
ncbi:MAG: alpha/beta hydrolase family protein [Lachnospiraceae bacterium]|nr:alpha/beta hydrolase family protein [Lachnospiraceae bacterium]